MLETKDNVVEDCFKKVVMRFNRSGQISKEISV